MSDAGWYADPAGTPQQRWWDGFRWTSHVQPAPFVMSLAPEPVPSGRFRWGLGAADTALVLGIVALVFNPLWLVSVSALIGALVGVRRADGRVRAIGGMVLAAAGMLLR